MSVYVKKTVKAIISINSSLIKILKKGSHKNMKEIFANIWTEKTKNEI